MATNNAVQYQKDIFAAIGPTGAGDSAIVDLFKYGGASKFSAQAVYDVTAVPAAAVITTANITISSDPDHPSQFHKTAHGLVTGMVVQATTAGTLAVPLVVSTNYYVIKIDADYFALAASYADAIAGTKIAITNVGVTSTTLTPTALAASVTFYKSNDAINWETIQTATTITVDGNTMVEKADVAYHYFKATKVLTGGNVDLKCNVLVIGDAV
jgi:hypothetical protein